MQDEEAGQTDEAVEPTAEGSEGAADASAEDTEDASAEDTAGADDDSADDDVSEEDAGTAEAVDMSAAQSSGSTVLAEPEVPDDANDKIAAAQEHINSLNMDEERAAAEKAAKNT